MIRVSPQIRALIENRSASVAAPRQQLATSDWLSALAALHLPGKARHAATNLLGTEPQHRLADIPALTADFARAGLRIQLEMEAVGRLSPAIELSAYRIVQEGLTDVLKHAPASSVRVRLTRSPHELAVEIENDRPAPNGRPTIPSGHGLAGLRERVALFSGSLTARARGEGGFLLAATIPLGSGK